MQAAWKLKWRLHALLRLVVLFFFLRSRLPLLCVFTAHGGDILLERETVIHRHGGPGYTQGLPSPTRYGYVPGSPRSAYNSPQ